MPDLTMLDLDHLQTPAAVIDVARMRANISRMQARMDALGVRFRPHVKTAKCRQVFQAQVEAGAQGITVSTLKEAEQFFDWGATDILYAVGISADKLPRALALLRRGCGLTLVTDNVAVARELGHFGRQHGVAFDVLIEIDTDGHRSGIAPDSAALNDVARALIDAGARVAGVMTHAGSSYDLDTDAALQAMAEQERAGAVLAAQRLRQAGFPCPMVSVGSTPTALSARQLEGVTEVRAGVYVFFDLVMRNVGVCSDNDIALGVLTSVTGHQEDKGWAITDAGWMAMSRDRGTQKQKCDFGYGQVCDANGVALPGYIVSGANQEHGIVSCVGGSQKDIVEQFPVGTRLRILPNHACATGAQHPQYQAVHGDGTIETWPRFYGW